MSEAPKSSSLRHRIQFQAEQLTSDGQGGQVQAWAPAFMYDVDGVPTAASEFASITPKTARNQWHAQQVQEHRTHVVVTRYRAGVVSDMRILRVEDGRIFRILGEVRPDEKKFWLFIDVQEVVGHG